MNVGWVGTNFVFSRIEHERGNLKESGRFKGWIGGKCYITWLILSDRTGEGKQP